MQEIYGYCLPCDVSLWFMSLYNILLFNMHTVTLAIMKEPFEDSCCKGLLHWYFYLIVDLEIVISSLFMRIGMNYLYTGVWFYFVLSIKYGFPTAPWFLRYFTTIWKDFNWKCYCSCGFSASTGTEILHHREFCCIPVCIVVKM